MAELEFAGIKFKGGKIVAVVMALSTLGGGAWAGFEFYKDYMDMREKIRNSIETNDTKVRKMVSDATDRFGKRREQTRKDMDTLEIRLKAEMKALSDTINNKIQKALENPLANMRK